MITMTSAVGRAMVLATTGVAIATIGALPVSAVPASDPASRPYYSASPRRPLPATSVKITDNFWAPKMQVYLQKTVPHNWQYVSGDILANEIAAGWKQASSEGYVWSQANLHKVLETVAYSLAMEPDAELEKKADYIVSAIAAAQMPDGYIDPPVTLNNKTRWGHLDGQHEGYVMGHMIEAAVAYYEATGKKQFLDVACKAADHIYDYFITQKHEGVCGHAELELALALLYRVTGEKRYVQLAKEWVERRGKPWSGWTHGDRKYFMDHLPIRQAPEVVGHAVRTMFYLTGVTEAATETNDTTLKAAARRLWANTTTKKMYITGSVGALAQDEAFGANWQLPNNGYCESCAACGLIYYSQAMFLMDGKADSIDVMERVLYNGLLHGISLDGTTTYYCNPLTDENHSRDNCWVCCPPCISKTLLRVPEWIYAESKDGIYVNLYVGSEATAKAKGAYVKLTQKTDYPWNGKVEITVRLEKRASFAIRLRVPGWAREWSIKINGKAANAARSTDGYLLVRRQWTAGDKIELNFPMPVERIEAHPEVKDDCGMVAMQRGPMAYALEGVDNEGITDVTLPADPQFNALYKLDLLNGVSVITGKRADGGGFTAIPFYALANRDKSRQQVWVRQEGLEQRADGWEGVLYRPLNGIRTPSSSDGSE